MMDHIIRLEESKDSQQLELQFTASSVYGPFLHERDNWAVVTESEIVFFNNAGNLAINQLSEPRHKTRHLSNMQNNHFAYNVKRSTSSFI